MIEKLNRFLNQTRQRYVWIIGAVIWLAWLVNFIGGSGILDLTGNNKGTDFMAYFTAGKIILLGKSTDLYNLELVNSIQQSLYQGTSPGFYPYLYPPHYALAMVPFALMPYTIAYLIWVAIGFIGFWFSFKWLGVQKPLHSLLLSLTWFPIFAVISFGQNSFFSLAIFCLTYYLWNKDKNLLAGLTFSLLFYKPQFLVFVAFLWLLDWKKCWKALAGLALGVILQIALNFFLLPQASFSYIHYAQKSILNFMFIKEFPIWNSFAVQAFWLGLFPDYPDIARVLYLICAVLGSIYFFKIWKKHKENRSITFSITMIWLVWCIPYIMVYDWTLLLIPAILFWTKDGSRKPVWKVLFAIFWIAALLSSPLTYLQLKAIPFALQLAIPALFFGCYIIYKALMRTENTTPSSS